MNNTIPLRFSPLAFASLLLISGCGDDSGTGGAGGTGTTSSTTSSTTTTTTSTTSTTTTGTTTSASTSTGMGGGAAAAPECESDADCYLNSDCCECAGRPVGENPPACALDCLIDSCTSFGVAGAATCQAGRCVTPADCDQSTVVCLGPSPECDPGSQPIIANGCYAGGCMPVGECAKVTDCDDCAGVVNTTCVQNVSQLPSSHCVDLAAPCNSADCACLGPSVCVGSFDLCSETGDGLQCACPACISSP